MRADSKIHVLDTGPLSHFARSQWLGVLKAVLQDTRVLIPDVVGAELRSGVGQYSYLQAALDAEWIQEVPLDSPEQLAAFARYERRLVGQDGRNVGECGVLALAETTENALAIVDDREAVLAAREGVLRQPRAASDLAEILETQSRKVGTTFPRSRRRGGGERGR